MRTFLLMVAALVISVPAGAQERLADQLRKGIVEEEANQNLDKAIQAYQSIVARYDEDRKSAGTAMFRLAECYRKAGKREQAIAAYQRVTREFADQAALVEPSRQQLASLGVHESREVRPTRASTPVERPHVEAPRGGVPGGAVVKTPPPFSERPTESLGETVIEMDAARRRLEDVQKRFELGQVTEMAVRDAQAEVWRLQERISQFEAQAQLTERMIRSVEAEIKLVQLRIAGIEKKVAAGEVGADDAELLQLRRDLLGLQRKADELKLNLRR